MIFRLNPELTICWIDRFPEMPVLTLTDWCLGGAWCCSAATTLSFVPIFRVIGCFTHFIEHQTIALATLSGLSIGLITTVYPSRRLAFSSQIKSLQVGILNFSW